MLGGMRSLTCICGAYTLDPMKRLSDPGMWIGLAAALTALLFIGMPLLMMALQSAPCAQVADHCRDNSYGFEITFVAVAVLFVGVWWATARGVRWWMGEDR